MTEIRVPDLGDAVMGATVSMWHYSVGDSVKREEDLVELVTDKATFNLPSPVAGRLKEIKVNEGETVKSGDLIAILE